MKTFLLILFFVCSKLLAQQNFITQTDFYDSLKNNFVEYRDGDKYGFMDIRTKKIVVPALYNFILDRTDKFACVDLNSKKGIIDYENKIKLPFEYQNIRIENKFIHAVSNKESNSRIEKHNYFDNNFNLKFSFDAEDITSFGANNFAYYRIGKQSKVIDTSGKTTFDFPVSLTSRGVYYNCYYNGIKGKDIILSCQDTVSKQFRNIRINEKKEILFSPIDTVSGNVTKLSSSFFLIEKRNSNDIYSQRSLPEFFVSDSTGKRFNETPFYNSIHNYRKLMQVSNKEGLYGFINTKGKLVIPFKYSSEMQFFEGLAPFIYMETKLIGFIDTSDAVVIKPQIHVLNLMDNQINWGFHENLCAIKISNVKIEKFTEADDDNYAIAYIDKNGNRKIELARDVRLANFFSDGLAAVVNSKQMLGFIDKSGKLIIPFKYKIDSKDLNYLPYFTNGFCKTSKGYIDKKGYEYFKN